MRILIDAKGDALKPSRTLAPVIKKCCEALVAINRLVIANHEVPSLYLSGVRYRNEPADWRVEHFDNARTVNERGWGDCDDLASWRCAELQNQGIAAGIIVSWKPTRGGKLYHVTVRLPNGQKEDPSARLGMRT